MSNILPKDSSKVSYTLKITVSKQFDNFTKRALRVTETGTSRIDDITLSGSRFHALITPNYFIFMGYLRKMREN